MKRISLSLYVLLAAMGPAVAADTTVRIESVPDANPECMERNGPDCVLRSQVVPPRTATSPGVVVVPAPTTPMTLVPQGAVGVPAPTPSNPAAQDTTTVIMPDSSTFITPGNPSVITPGSTVLTPSPGSTVIAPRRK